MGVLVHKVEQAEALWYVVAMEVVAKVGEPDRILKAIQSVSRDFPSSHLDENCVILWANDSARFLSLEKQIVLNRAPQLRYYI